MAKSPVFPLRRSNSSPEFEDATKLEKELKREIAIGGKPFVVRIDPDCLKVPEKGRRKGAELLWKDLVNGEAARAAALNASLSGS